MAAPPHHIDHHRFQAGQVLQGFYALQAQMVGRDVQHRAHIGPVDAQALAQDAAARRLDHGHVDRGITQHHARATRAGRVAGGDQFTADIHAGRTGHPHGQALGRQHMRHHAGCRAFAVGSGHGQNRNPGTRATRIQHLDHGAAHISRLPFRRMKVHPESRRGIHFDDAAARFAHRLSNIGGQKVYACNIQPHSLRGAAGEQGVGRVNVVGAVDCCAAGRQVGRGAQHHRLAPTRPESSDNPAAASSSRTCASTRMRVITFRDLALAGDRGSLRR